MDYYRYLETIFKTRTAAQLYQKAHKLGFKKRCRPPPWTDDEDRALRRDLSTDTMRPNWERLASQFGRWTASFLKVKAWLLGFTPVYQEWRKEEVAVLRQFVFGEDVVEKNDPTFDYWCSDPGVWDFPYNKVPGRSFTAAKRRAVKLWGNLNVSPWTPNGETLFRNLLLRKGFSYASMHEILRKFPDQTLMSLRKKAGSVLYHCRILFLEDRAVFLRRHRQSRHILRWLTPVIPRNPPLGELQLVVQLFDEASVAHYLKARGETLNDTAALFDCYQESEMYLVLYHTNLFSVYLQARTDFTNTMRADAGFGIMGDMSDHDLLLYLRVRGSSLKETRDLEEEFIELSSNEIQECWASFIEQRTVIRDVLQSLADPSHVWDNGSQREDMECVESEELIVIPIEHE